MRLSINAFAFLTALVIVAAADEVILRQGDILEPGTWLKTSNGACRLKLQRDGNLVARRRGPFWPKAGGYSDPIPSSISWTSGSHAVSDYYYAALSQEGNLQVRENDIGPDPVVYTTKVYAPSLANATHVLVFTDKCALRIMRREGDEYHRIWTNIHEWFDNFSADENPGMDNVLHKGDYYTYPTQNYGTVCGKGANFCYQVPFSLRLQHDCNLVVFVGHDQGDLSAIVWSAGVARNVSDCFLLVDSHDVALYEGSFDPTLPRDYSFPNKYWSVPSSFFDVDSYTPGGYNTYQVLINNEGEMYLDWD